MREPIKDHMHLWKMLYCGAKIGWESGCHADWEDCASFLYPKFVDKYRDEPERWTTSFAVSYAKYRAGHYRQRVWYCERMGYDLLGERVEQLKVQMEMDADFQEPQREPFVKCLKDIGKLMDKVERGYAYSRVKVKTSTFLKKITPPEHSGGTVRSAALFTPEVVKKIGLSKDSCKHKITTFRKNRKAREIWNKCKKEVYS